MNVCIFIGNLTRDPEIRTTPQGHTTARFTIAVQRNYKNKQTGGYDCDFIKCVAWRATADLVGRYFKKGSKIGVTGRMTTDSYEKDGNKVPTIELNVDSIDFCGGKGEKADEPYVAPTVSLDEFADFAPADDNELPF